MNVDFDRGIWIPAGTAVHLLKLRIRPYSAWNVYLAIVLTACRFNGRKAFLSVDDISLMTGYSTRAVKSAIQKLVKKGFIRRIKRSRNFEVMLSSEIEPKEPAVRGATKPAPQRCTQDCTSANAIDTDNSNSMFTKRQIKIIDRFLSEWSRDFVVSDLPVLKQFGIKTPVKIGDLVKTVSERGDKRHRWKLISFLKRAGHLGDLEDEGRELPL